MRATVIGRFARVRHAGALMVATVIDSYAGENRAKRVRVQTPGARQGQVLMPGEYELVEFV